MGVMAGRGEMPTTRVKLTYDDFVLFPDDGMRHELIDGEHYVTPSPNTRHQRVSLRLTMDLANWLREHPTGELFVAPFDVVFSRFDIVVPDLLYLSNERRATALTDEHALGADLVIEIASPGTRRRDVGIKLQLYERAGVLEYWFVDADACVVHLYRRVGHEFSAAVSGSGDAGAVLTTPLLPGLHISLPELFRA